MKCTSPNAAGLLERGGEAQPAGSSVLAQQLVQAGLVDGQFALG